MAIGSITGIVLTYNNDPVVSSRPRSMTSVASVYKKLGVGLKALRGADVRKVLGTKRHSGRLKRPMLLSPIKTKTDEFEARVTLGLVGRVGFSIVQNGISRVGALTCKDKDAGNMSTSLARTIGREGLRRDVSFVGNFTGGGRTVIVVAKTVSLIASNRGYCMVEGKHSRVKEVANAKYRLSNVAATFLTTGPGEGLRTTITTIYVVNITNRVT